MEQCRHLRAWITGETQTMAAATEEQAHAAAQAAVQEADAEAAEEGLQDMDTEDPIAPQDDDPAAHVNPEQATTLPTRADDPQQGKQQKGGRQNPGGRMEMDPGQIEDDAAGLKGASDDEGMAEDRQGDDGSFAAQLQRVTLGDEASAGAGAEASTDLANPQGISADRMEMLRDQVAQALHGNAAQETSSLPGAAEYGQQMWSRCEALTSGVRPACITAASGMIHPRATAPALMAACRASSKRGWPPAKLSDTALKPLKIVYCLGTSDCNGINKSELIQRCDWPPIHTSHLDGGTVFQWLRQSSVALANLGIALTDGQQQHHQ